MPPRTTISVPLTSDRRRFVERSVRSGRCRSASDVVLQALRAWARIEGSPTDARRRIAAGLDDAASGRFVDPDATFRRVDRKIARARRARR